MSNNADLELEHLLQQQAILNAELEKAKRNSIYQHFLSLIDLLQKRDIKVKEYFEIGDELYTNEHGFSSSLITHDVGFKNNGDLRTLPPKYRDTIVGSNVWSGRGKQPKWLKERLAAGHSIEEFIVAE